MCKKDAMTIDRGLTELRGIPLGEWTDSELRGVIDVTIAASTSARLDMDAHSFAYSHYRREADETRAKLHADKHGQAMFLLGLHDTYLSTLEAEMRKRNPFYGE